MKKINFTLTGIITAFLAIAIVVGFVYHTGRQRKPLVFAIIPDGTKSWADEISKHNTVNISIVDKGPFNWEQEKDLGNQQISARRYCRGGGSGEYRGLQCIIFLTTSNGAAI